MTDVLYIIEFFGCQVFENLGKCLYFRDPRKYEG